jgi:hypothetical protein
MSYHVYIQARIEKVLLFLISRFVCYREEGASSDNSERQWSRYC